MGELDFINKERLMEFKSETKISLADEDGNNRFVLLKVEKNEGAGGKRNHDYD